MAMTGAQKQAAYFARNPEKCRARWRAYAMSPRGTITALLNYAHDRARKDGLAYDLDREWLSEKLERGVCEVSGLPVRRISPGDYRTHPYAPSLDRIVPALGYVKSNTRLVLFAVNRAMSDWGQEVLLTIARAIVNKASS